jgi:hypothetical protein
MNKMKSMQTRSSKTKNDPECKVFFSALRIHYNLNNEYGKPKWH